MRGLLRVSFTPFHAVSRPITEFTFSTGGADESIGSIAASWQASIGAVQAGSAFAVLQSAGMTVVGTTLVPAAGVVMGVWGAVKRAFGAGHEEEGGK